MNDINLSQEIDKYFDESSLARNSKPIFALIMGGTGAGKTTRRKKEYADGYVLLDAGDIFKKICKGLDLEYRFGQDFRDLMEAIGQGVADRAICEKRNVVMEIIGANAEPVEKLIDAMNSCGYETDLQYVVCEDLMEAYERHKKGAMEFISAYFSEPHHMRWLITAVTKNLKQR